ncbi:hypothetical protein TURU_004685 [Turdus rufiventris]|nr:hypothetical protein TURU_004685 [Turdus rufiventris]
MPAEAPPHLHLAAIALPDSPGSQLSLPVNHTDFHITKIKQRHKFWQTLRSQFCRYGVLLHARKDNQTFQALIVLNEAMLASTKHILIFHAPKYILKRIYALILLGTEGDIVGTGQHAIGLLGHWGTLVHVQLLLTSNPRAFSLGPLSTTLHEPVALDGAVELQDLAWHVEPHIPGLVHQSSLSEHSAEPFYPQADQHSCQLSVACKFTYPLTQITNINLKRFTEPWETSLVTSHQLDVILFTAIVLA